MSLLYRLRHSIQDTAGPLSGRVYELAVNHGAWWTLDRKPHRKPAAGPKRIGYYLWQFPVTSQTFVRREVQALRAAGVTVEIFADECGDFKDEALTASTHYLELHDRDRLGQAKRYFRRARGLAYANIFVYTLLQRYGAYKTAREDIWVFESAVRLADALREQGITHVHAPWADRTAFVALLASRLLDIPYSVQARAHDLHRTASQYALGEKFAHAEFIVTNSDYNARTIEGYLGARSQTPVHIIRNLFPPEEFACAGCECPSGPFRILCVARLIEEKGLVYLLRACAELRARGIPFQCEIIGAPEEPEYTAYLIQLKRLHRQLQLEDCVTFSGAQAFENVVNKYACADLFVLPCVIAGNGGRDISPNSLIEAMTMGLPVISTQLSAIPEIVENGVNGILVPPNDATALADAMSRVLRDESLRRELGARARARARDRYDAKKNAAQYATLFRAHA